MNRPKPTGPQRPLHHIFNRFSRKAVKDFPELRGHFLVIDSESGKTYGSFSSSPLKKKIVSTLDYTMGAPEGHHRAAAWMESKGDGTYVRTLLAKKLSTTHRIATSTKDSIENEINAILEHELGHLVAPGGYFGAAGILKECVADSFAQMRRLQKTGINNIDDQLDTAIWARTLHIVFHGRTSHYTAPALRIMKNPAFKSQIKNLSPKQVGETALRLAVTAQLSERAQRQNYGSLLVDTCAAYKQGGVEAALIKTAELFLDNEKPLNAHMQKICCDLLSPILSGRTDITLAQIDIATLAAINFETPIWQSARDKIAAIESREKSHTVKNASNFHELLHAATIEATPHIALGAFDNMHGRAFTRENYASILNMAYAQSCTTVYALARRMQENGGVLDIEPVQESLRHSIHDANMIRVLFEKVIPALKQTDVSCSNTAEIAKMSESLMRAHLPEHYLAVPSYTTLEYEAEEDKKIRRPSVRRSL